MQLILWPILTWIFREVVIKFVIFAALFAVVAFMVPKAIALLGDFIGTGGLTSVFAALPPGIWYFLDIFQISYGLPLIISAWVSRFLIRRLPVIG